MTSATTRHMRRWLRRAQRKALLPLAALVLWLAMTPATASAAVLAETQSDSADLYCLAAAVHTEAASQSMAAKRAIAAWILARAGDKPVCGFLADSREIAAAHTPPGTWAYDVFHNGDLLRRMRGPESWRAAADVLVEPAPSAFAHFDSCDSQAAWTDRYARVRLSADDRVCFWE